MTLRLYNTLTRHIEPFEPLEPKRVKMYVCGPTVYDDPHLGHARSAYVFDVARRYLQHRGFDVTFVRNVTDVDDKIIQKSHETGASVEAVSARYLGSYHAMLERLGIIPPSTEPCATQHIDEMLDLISQLLVEGHAYAAQGDVCFAVRKFAHYGRLSNRTLDELQAGARVEPGEQKQDPLDFALWKAAKPGEPSWPSPWWQGRPGWHIECSAMSTKYLGDAFDIHGGGLDLIFPHHENEIAQAQAAGKPFAKYWMHNGLLTINGQKMSKSLGNFVTVEQAAGACRDNADALKMFFLGSHYRSPVDYTVVNIVAAYHRWWSLALLLKQARNMEEGWNESIAHRPAPDWAMKTINDIRSEFEAAMDDDLNTPRALACFHKLVDQAIEWRRKTTIALPNPKGQSTIPEIPPWLHAIIEAARLLRHLGSSVFGLFDSALELTLELTDAQSAKIDARKSARDRRDFKTADRLRQELESDGIELEDTPEGTEWRRKR